MKLARFRWWCSRRRPAAPEFSGQVRPQSSPSKPTTPAPARAGRGAAARHRALPRSDGAVETELRVSGHGLTLVGTEQQQRIEGIGCRSQRLGQRV